MNGHFLSAKLVTRNGAQQKKKKEEIEIDWRSSSNTSNTAPLQKVLMCMQDGSASSGGGGGGSMSAAVLPKADRYDVIEEVKEVVILAFDGRRDHPSRHFEAGVHSAIGTGSDECTVAAVLVLVHDLLLSLMMQLMA
ncbi:hypothetical protein TYRP_016588 [Tyrophagus putrescentiae]|nr:hypothetical protein TYRP_016588 [Tyrophagus putrescentiae]